MTQRDIARLGGVSILTLGDIPELKQGVRQVFHLMQDGDWHDGEEIRGAAGQGVSEATEGLRRMRELRQWFKVERRHAGGRRWEYRLRAPWCDDKEPPAETQGKML